MTMIDHSGRYLLTHEDYHSDPCIVPSLSRSIIKDLLYDCPLKARLNHPRLNPEYRQSTDEKFDLGTAIHSLLLDGIDRAALIYGDDFRKKEAREARDKARAEGKIPLLADQYETCQKAVKVVQKAIYECDELQIGRLKTQGDSELSYFWQEESGAWCRIRPDWISHDRKLIIDYKSTRQSANPEEVGRTIVNMGLDIQESLYRRGVKAIEGTDPKFIFVFQEMEAPYLCSFVGLPPEWQVMGEQKVSYGIYLWEECLRLDKWPGYPNQVVWIEPQAWALTAWEYKAQSLGGIK